MKQQRLFCLSPLPTNVNKLFTVVGTWTEKATSLFAIVIIVAKPC